MLTKTHTSIKIIPPADFDMKYHEPITTPKSWVVWSMAGLFYLYEMVLRVSAGVMTTQLMDDFMVTSTALGVLVSFYYYAYVPLQIPCGIIVDKLGPRFILTASSLVCAAGSFIFAGADSLYAAQVGRFLVGAGSACAFISCLKVTADWFSPAQFALVAGLSNMMGTFGGTLAGTPLAILIKNVGWREATTILAYVGLVVAALCWIFIRNHPAGYRPEKKTTQGLWRSLLILSKNKQIWLAGIIGGLMYLPISAFSELWAVPFLMATFHVSSEVAAGANIMVFIGMAFGSPMAASLTDYLKSYTAVMKGSAFITSALFFAIAFASYMPFYAVYVLLFLAGFAIGGQVLCFTSAKDSSTLEMSGTTVAFTNALVMMSGIIFQPLLGGLLDLFWGGQIAENGLRIYDQSAYQMAIIALPVSLFFSWYLLRFVRETYAQDHHS
jgi:predicted MFS family arabinose efflux permease